MFTVSTEAREAPRWPPLAAASLAATQTANCRHSPSAHIGRIRILTESSDHLTLRLVVGIDKSFKHGVECENSTNYLRTRCWIEVWAAGVCVWSFSSLPHSHGEIENIKSKREESEHLQWVVVTAAVTSLPSLFIRHSVVEDIQHEVRQDLQHFEIFRWKCCCFVTSRPGQRSGRGGSSGHDSWRGR